MSFKFNNASAPATAAQDESWKAQGFINIYLPTKGGGERKLGTIALHEKKPAEKQLIDWLKADEKNIQTLVGKLMFNFNTAEPKEGSEFDLSVAPATGTNG